MRVLPSLFIAIWLVGSSSLQATLPKFSDYAVPHSLLFTGVPAPVDFSSYKDANTYHTILSKGAEKGPNFAGHYTVVSFGCGTQCQDNWIIDAVTGKIHARFSSIIGQKYQVDSLLMVVNPPEEQLKRAYEQYPDQPLLGEMDTTAQVWENNEFKVIQTIKWVDAIKEIH